MPKVARGSGPNSSAIGTSIGNNCFGSAVEKFSTQCDILVYSWKVFVLGDGEETGDERAGSHRNCLFSDRSMAFVFVLFCYTYTVSEGGRCHARVDTWNVCATRSVCACVGLRFSLVFPWARGLSSNAGAAGIII